MKPRKPKPKPKRMKPEARLAIVSNDTGSLLYLFPPYWTLKQVRGYLGRYVNPRVQRVRIVEVTK